MKKRLLSILLVAILLLGLLPTAALASNSNAAPLQVLMIGNSHTVDMTEWTDLVLQDSGLKDQIQITRLTPMGGRKLFTDDTARSSHITAATWPGTEDAWNATHQDNGRDVGSKKSQYETLLNDSGKTWDLIVVQDWEESTINSDSAAVASGIQRAVQWLRSYPSVTADTKIAWAADWPDAANHAGAQGNMTGAIAAVNALTENGVDFIIPTGLTVENARTSYFDKVNNADDSYLPGSEETYGGIANVAKYHLMERDANHLSYELGCYSVAAVTIAEIAAQFTLMDLDAFLTSLKTAPKWESPAEWKGEFNDNIWAVVKESVKNAVEHPTQVTQSVYTEDPADAIAAQILAAGYTENAAAAAETNSEEQLSKVAEAVEEKAQAAAGAAAALSVSSTYTAPVAGTADNKTGTAGKYEIKVSFLNGYTQKNLAVISGAIKPDYYEGGAEELAAAKTAAAADLAKTAALVGKDAEAYSSEINAAYSTNDVDTALAEAKAALVADAGYLYADWIGADGWTVGTKMPLGKDTGVRFTIREEGVDTVLTISGSGKIPDLVMQNEPTRSYTSPIWMNDDVSGKITKVVVEDGVKLGHMSLWLSRVKTIEIGENVTLPANAIYLNGQNCDRTITFKGAATVSNRSIDGYTGTDGKGCQAAQNAQIFVYADFNKLGVSSAERFVGSTVLKNNNYGLPIVVVINTGSSVEPEEIVLAQDNVPANGWQAVGTPFAGDDSGVTYTIKKIGDEVVLEFSGRGTIPTFKTTTPHYQNTSWWGTNSGSAVTKVIVNGGVTVGDLTLFLPTAKEIVLKDGVRLNQNAIYFNTQNVDTEITFECSATVANASISWHSGSSQKDKAVQITVTADFSKLKKSSGSRVTKASDFIDNGLLTTLNKNDLPIVVAVNTEDSRADAQEFDITTGGWDENGNTVGSSTGVKYKIYTVGADTIVEFSGNGTMPDYWATGNDKDPNLSTGRLPWRNTPVTKIIVGEGVAPGQMSLYVKNSVREIVFEGDVTLQKRDIIYFNTLTQDVNIFFNGSNNILAGRAVDGYGVGNAHHVTIYAKSGALKVGDTSIANASQINLFVANVLLAEHTDATAIAQLVLDDQLSAAKSIVNTSEIVALSGTCQQNTESGKKTAVETYVKNKLGEQYASIEVSAAKKAAAVYTITLSDSQRNTSFDLTFTFAFFHDWHYTASGATITAECTYCKGKQAARLVASNQKETGDAIEASVSYGTVWPGGALTVSYAKDGAPFDGTPKDAGSYTASIEVSGTKASADFVISHDLRSVAETPATCTAPGNLAYWTCDVCGKNFSNAQGTAEIADFDTWKAGAGKLNATGHSYGEAAYQWSADGKSCTTEKVCAHCQNKVTETVETVGRVKTPATRTAKGTTTYTATFSKDGFTEQSMDVEDLPMIPHDWSSKDGVCKNCQAKCSAAHNPGTTCPVCGKYTPIPVVPAGEPVKNPFNPDAGKTKFTDVSGNAWYASAVNYAVDKGLMNGTGDGKFSPNADTTRGMIVTILARLDGKNTSGTPWYAAGQQWAMEHEISDGTT